MGVTFDKLVNFGNNIVLGAVLTLAGLHMSGLLSVTKFLTSFVVSIGIGYIVCDLIPAVKWAGNVTKNMKNSLAKKLISTAISSFIYVLIISFFNIFVAVDFAVIEVLIQTFPCLYILGFLSILLSMPVSKKVATILLKHDTFVSNKNA